MRESIGDDLADAAAEPQPRSGKPTPACDADSSRWPAQWAAWLPSTSGRLTTAMVEALRLAREAVHPFGSVVVDGRTGEIVLSAPNTGHLGDPTAHAEINALRAAAAAGMTLAESVIVTTAEPCPMCIGALMFGRVGGVVFGTSIATLITLGYPQIDIDATKSPADPRFTVSRSWAGGC